MALILENLQFLLKIWEKNALQPFECLPQAFAQFVIQFASVDAAV